MLAILEGVFQVFTNYYVTYKLVNSFLKPFYVSAKYLTLFCCRTLLESKFYNIA